MVQLHKFDNLSFAAVKTCVNIVSELLNEVIYLYMEPQLLVEIYFCNLLATNVLLCLNHEII